MHRPGGCRPLLSRELSGLVWMFEQTHLFFPHAVVHVCQRLHLYGDKKEGESYSKFLVKKLKRLMLPYVVVSVIVISIKMLTEKHAFVENPVTAYAYIKMLYFPEAGYFLWFIWALWWMFVIAPLFATKQKDYCSLVRHCFCTAFLRFCRKCFVSNNSKACWCFYPWCCLLRLEQDCNIRKNSVLGCMPVICRAWILLYKIWRMSFSHPFVGIATIIYLSDIISRGAKKSMVCWQYRRQAI